MLSEKKFIIDGIKQELRCDGRNLLTSRVLEVQQNSELLAAGSSQISIELFSPHLICGIKAEISDSPGCFLTIEPAGKSAVSARERLKEIKTILQSLLLNNLKEKQLEILTDKKY